MRHNTVPTHGSSKVLLTSPASVYSPNAILASHPLQEIDPKLRITRVVDGKTALAQLPASLFQNGYSHCINQMHKVRRVERQYRNLWPPYVPQTYVRAAWQT